MNGKLEVVINPSLVDLVWLGYSDGIIDTLSICKTTIQPEEMMAMKVLTEDEEFVILSVDKE